MTNHFERPPAACAAAASSSIRSLNHLTIDPRTCTLEDVYDVLGALGELAARLDQSTLQLADVLEGRLTAGGLRIDASSGGTPASVVDACQEDLVAAGSLAGRLEGLISAAHRRVGTLADTPTPHSPSGRSVQSSIRRPTQIASRPGPRRSM